MFTQIKNYNHLFKYFKNNIKHIKYQQINSVIKALYQNKIYLQIFNFYFIYIFVSTSLLTNFNFIICPYFYFFYTNYY